MDRARHSAISSRLVKPFVFSDRPLIVQYEVQLQEGQECGGAYIKLLSSGKETTDLKDFHDKTPYTVSSSDQLLTIFNFFRFCVVLVASFSF